MNPGVSLSCRLWLLVGLLAVVVVLGGGPSQRMPASVDFEESADSAVAQQRPPSPARMILDDGEGRSTGTPKGLAGGLFDLTRGERGSAAPGQDSDETDGLRDFHSGAWMTLRRTSGITGGFRIGGDAAGDLPVQSPFMGTGAGGTSAGDFSLHVGLFEGWGSLEEGFLSDSPGVGNDWVVIAYDAGELSVPGTRGADGGTAAGGLSGAGVLTGETLENAAGSGGGWIDNDGIEGALAGFAFPEDPRVTVVPEPGGLLLLSTSLLIFGPASARRGQRRNPGR